MSAPSCAQRGWRFFAWPGVTAAGEKEIDVDHVYAKLFSRIEEQIASRLRSYGVAPLEDVDVCFFHGERTSESGAKRHGTSGVNVENRLQLTMRMPTDMKQRDLFVQVCCHEYCHALELRALLQAHHGGTPDYTERSDDIIKSKRNDVVVSEALADTFALTMHNKATLFHDSTPILPYDQLVASHDYDDAYSLKLFLHSLLSAAQGPRRGSFVFKALAARAEDATPGLFECLRRGVEEDTAVNPDGRSFRDLYEEFRHAHHRSHDDSG